MKISATTGLMSGYDLLSGNLRENASVMFSMELNHWDDRTDDNQSSFALAEKIQSSLFTK